jgi:signal transduction histidine kinase
MTAMVGYTDLLLGEQVGILNEMQRQFLVRIKANVEQMGRLLNDLLRLASPDSRRLELVPEPVDLITTVQTVLTALAARFNERRLKVRLNFPPQIAPLRVDRDSLYQIMLRLLSNAALCSQEGSEILVGAREESAPTKDKPPYISVAVTDTGGGIAPEDLARVFRRFYRAGQPLIAGMGETGVGMAVAKTLVEANGGRIWVESLPGEGSTFNFALPAFWENHES